MYRTYNYKVNPQNMRYQNLSQQNSFNSTNSIPNDERFFAGGFLGPFVLGGITGGLLAPAFNNNGRPINNNYYPPYPPYPPYSPYPPYYYGPYYR